MSSSQSYTSSVSHQYTETVLTSTHSFVATAALSWTARSVDSLRSARRCVKICHTMSNLALSSSDVTHWPISQASLRFRMRNLVVVSNVHVFNSESIQWLWLA